MLQDIIGFIKGINETTSFRDLLEAVLNIENTKLTPEIYRVINDRNVAIINDKYNAIRDNINEKIKITENNLQELKNNFNNLIGTEVEDSSAPEGVDATFELTEKNIK